MGATSNFKILDFGTAILCCVVFSCAQNESSQNIRTSTANGAANAVISAPPPPKNVLSGDGFGLSSLDLSDAPNPNGYSSSQQPFFNVPAGGIRADSGYWFRPSDQNIAQSNPGILQFYNSAGVPQPWFGGYGVPSNSGGFMTTSNPNVFTMINYSGSGPLNFNQQFQVQKNSSGQWASGQILNQSGQPYTFGNPGQQIVSNGFTYTGTGGAANYNWMAINGTGTGNQQMFQTPGWNILQGLQSGMAFRPVQNGTTMPTNGQLPNGTTPGVLQPTMYQPNGTVSSPISAIPGFFSALFK